ncbi:pentapeptide repeat protein [Gloeothece citriformis PCC 7424]|uniref:Pentapeptide repeat protein n=1 Tax=Gloeothece citriformis (strain PCC 7424) TaxID=65393 RepID=B7KAA3_GLOC7|nr:pentapeptide repeat-containing protein [Gloeothece citriformis]ACK72877.1 pentapeptide repeat protein [Gloeothece citriformis PCC 7424]
MTNQPDSNTTSNQEGNSTNGKTEENSSGNSVHLIIPPPQPLSQQPFYQQEVNPSDPRILLTAIAIMGIGLWLDQPWIGFSGGLVALFLSLRVIFPSIKAWFRQYLTPQERSSLLASIIFILAIVGMAKYFGVYQRISLWLNNFKYDEFGSWADWVGALGQIMIAVLAVYVAWQQYVISRDLTIQQNRITQQQTIDAYFQGVSDLVLDDQGMLEDWPQERALAEGRTAAILGSLNAEGKAKVLRFLSQSKLLTPLARDFRLGRPIFDGSGGYAEDREYGIRVITLGVMLAGADLSSTDLRWTDLSEANMVRANLHNCDLVKANLARTVLFEANLSQADLKGVRLFYGSIEFASPRSRSLPPNYETGAYTGAVLENTNLTGVKNLTEEQRYYCCAWGGEQTRATIPGGCEGIPNKLGR